MEHAALCGGKQDHPACASLNDCRLEPHPGNRMFLPPFKKNKEALCQPHLLNLTLNFLLTIPSALGLWSNYSDSTNFSGFPPIFSDNSEIPPLCKYVPLPFTRDYLSVQHNISR